MTDIRIDAVLTGTPRAFGPKGNTSSIAARYPVSEPVAVTPEGLAGDQVGDPTVHGDADKAIHHYPRDHYAAWITDLAPAPSFLAEVGAFGENISTSGITEETVCAGDVFRLGTARVQVSQGRQPCSKLNQRFDRKDMAKQVQDTGRSGWYYRVLEPGMVAPGDRLVLEARPNPDWTLARILHVLYVDTLNRADLEAIAGLPELAKGWRKIAAKRLERNAVEDWSPRIGPVDA
ncbi:MOSC domain-containing protein [Caenispirillum salinarum]|uniref:MOSC domain-containing protein n=1 Tax=Caenispirillum salinarum TaxID=859058 RepID=UPI00384B4A6B